MNARLSIPIRRPQAGQGSRRHVRECRLAAAQARCRRSRTKPTRRSTPSRKPGTDLNKGLRAIKDADPSFEPKTFVDGAKMAYEMIVMAYADGDRKTLKNLLSREVYDGFVAAIADREGRSEKIQSSFVGIDKADIVSAEMKGGEAHVTLRIVSELISATRNKAGEVIDGDPETVAEVKDVWTFARDTRSRDPNWKLVATEAED